MIEQTIRSAAEFGLALTLAVLFALSTLWFLHHLLRTIPRMQERFTGALASLISEFRQEVAAERQQSREDIAAERSECQRWHGENMVAHQLTHKMLDELRRRENAT